MCDFNIMAVLICNKMYLQRQCVFFFSGMAIFIISIGSTIS